MFSECKRGAFESLGIKHFCNPFEMFEVFTNSGCGISSEKTARTTFSVLILETHSDDCNMFEMD